MESSHPIIAIVDDYVGFVPSLDAYEMLKAALPDADIRVITQQPLDDAAIRRMHDVLYLLLIRERARISAKSLDRLPSLNDLVRTGSARQEDTPRLHYQVSASRGKSGRARRK